MLTISWLAQFLYGLAGIKLSLLDNSVAKVQDTCMKPFF